MRGPIRTMDVRDSSHQQIKDCVLTAGDQNPPVKSPGFIAWTGEIHGDIRQVPPPTPENALGAISAAIVSHNRDNNYKKLQRNHHRDARARR